MTKIFIDICDKNKLKYFAVSGTLLGAVRHDGFIPWDDDIDFMMPRADYERFTDICGAQLPNGFFLQCNKTEKRYPTGHAQIRNCKTTCLRTGELDRLKAGFNYGIFIDIFPYDDVSSDLSVRKKQADKIAALRKKCAMRVYPYSSSKLKRAVKAVISGLYFAFHSLEKSIKRIDELAMQPVDNAEYVGVTAFVPGYEKNIWEKRLFDEVRLHKFEDMEIAIPNHYDEVLSHEYGDDYMTNFAFNEASMHGACFYDAQTPYTEYAKLPYKKLLELCGNSEL